MVKEVEQKKLNGKLQYVDWETGEELFKKSDCISKDFLKTMIEDLKKELLNAEPMSTPEFEHKFLAIDYYNKLLEELK